MPTLLSGCDSPRKDNGAATPACDPTVQSCPLAPVTVQISLSAAVACPGHPFSITAVGTPSGGTFAWTISEAELVDSSGNRVNAGNNVFLRGFQADDATGKIPEKTATVTVNYTHPNGTATDSKPVKIHKIAFDVTDTAITAGLTQTDENAAQVILGRVGGVDTMDTKPKVKIKLDPSCPRKTDCAKNHRVGWLQTVLTNDRRLRYTHTLITISVPLPVRDGNPASPPSRIPFYDEVADFTSDADVQIAHHRDGPGNGAAWTDPRPTAPVPPPAKNRQLRKVFFQSGFRAWLVVQNKEWSAHDLAGSFAYQNNFDWSVHLDVTVDMTKAVGSRCSPTSAAPTIGAMANGKGASSPVLTAPVANDVVSVTSVAAPAI
jgi:hypothetical protein